MDLEERLRSSLRSHTGTTPLPDQIEPAWEAIQARLAGGRSRLPRLVAAVIAVVLAVAGLGFLAWAFFGGGKPRPTGPQPNGVIVFVKAGPRNGLGVDNTDLYAVNPDGTGVSDLTNTLAAESDPVWSPDGKKVVFTRTEITGSEGHALVESSGLYVMNGDGSGLRRIYDCGTGRCRVRHPAWSPDGSRLAFIGAFGPSTEALAVMNADGSDLRVLCGSFRRCGQGLLEPVWSPDGNKIAFSNARTLFFLGLGPIPSSIYVVDADGRHLTRLTNPDCHLGQRDIGSCPFYDSAPRWSPDGTKIVFGRYPTPDVDPRSSGGGRAATFLTIMNADGTGRRTLDICSSNSCPQLLRSAWSPDGRWLAYGVFDEARPSIRIVAADGSGAHVIRTCRDRRCVVPDSLRWSPDGTMLLLMGEGRGREAGVYTIHADGSGLRLVTAGVEDYAVDWLPRSAGIPAGSPVPSAASTPSPTVSPQLVPGLIAFTSRGEILTMRSDGSDIRQLTKNPGNPDFAIAWSPDGTKIAFASYRPGDPNTELYVMNADGSGQRRLTDFRYGAEMPTWSPDGSLIVFHAGIKGGIEGIFAIHPDGTGLRQLTHVANGDGDPAWSPDGSTIAFSRHAGKTGSFAIFLMDPDGSNIRQLTELPGEQQRARWTPDGSHVVFEWDTSVGSGWYIVDRDGAGLRRFSAVPGTAEFSWSPDGTRIAFSDSRVHTAGADGSDVAVLTWGLEAAWQPVPAG